VQEKALDAIEALGAESVSAELADYVALVAPSVRVRIAALAGVTADTAPVAEAGFAPSTAQSVVPISSPQEALALFLSVLEDPRDPFAVERTMDGVSRFGAALRADETAMSPLRKRAKQVFNAPGDGDIRMVLAITGRALAEGMDLAAILAEKSEGRGHRDFVSNLSVQEFHLARNAGILRQIGDGHALPLLSLPSDTSGMVRADDLVARMAVYREARVTPDLSDLALALMRLHPDGRSAAGLPTDTEPDRAVAYAMGAQVKVGPTPELWAAAWRARLPEAADDAVAKLFKAPTPDCGLPAKVELVVGAKHSDNGEYTWIVVSAPVTPENTTKSRALPALFGITARRYFEVGCSGYTFADIAWGSLVRPADPEPFFRAGLIQQDTWQKLSDNPTRAYLEPFFRPGPPVGPLGAGVLAYFMACEDKSVSSLAIEATAMLAVEGRLTSEGFTAALKPFLMSRALPTGRWTKAMKTVADLGAGEFARDVLVGLLDFAPEYTPRDIGGLLEVCYELHVAQNAALENARAIACLRTIPGGGKTARFSKKLLEIAA